MRMKDPSSHFSVHCLLTQHRNGVSSPYQRRTTELVMNYTAADLAHCIAKATECETRGNACKPGSASREMWFSQSRKWEATAEKARQSLR
jgi:beta-mannanase